MVLETEVDLQRLQEVLDESRRLAGPHLLSIISLERILSAAELANRLGGIRLLALATVTSSGKPVIGPVDGVFLRGEFWFGTSNTALHPQA